MPKRSSPTYTDGALQASDGRFRALFEQSPIPMTTQRGGLIIDANRAALALLGCDDPRDLIGHPGVERVAPHARAALIARAANDPAGLRPATYETVGLRFDGTEFPVLVQRTTIDLPDGPATMGSYMDLTDQKRIESERDRLVEDLRLSQHHLDEAQRITHVGSWERDIATGSLTWSDESCRIVGVEPGTFAGTVDAFLAFVHPDDRSLAAPNPAELAEAAGGARETEYRIIRPDGSVRLIREIGEVICDPDGVPVRFMGTSQDITDRVAAESERTRLASAVEQTPDSIWMQDLDNVVTYVNPSFTRLYGYEPAEIVRRHAGVVDSGVHEPAFFDEIWATVAAGKTWMGSIVNRRKDGTLFEVEAVISGITDAAGRVIGYMQTDRDVTRERALESDLERQARERDSIESALHGIDSSASPEEIATAACAAIVRLSDVGSAAVFDLTPGAEVVLGVAGLMSTQMPPGNVIPGGVAERLRTRTATGPWVHDVRIDPITSDSRSVVETGLQTTAYAPFAGPRGTFGIIGIGSHDPEEAPRLVERLSALAMYGSLLGAILGPGLDARHRGTEEQALVRADIEETAFSSYFQPIVDLASGRVVGYEALTRFSGHRSAAPIFAAAARAGLGIDLESATLRRAITAAELMPEDVYLSVNASPGFIASGKLARILAGPKRPTVIEITEHVPIIKYAAFRRALANLGPNTRLAVDDAGAGFASFRHILELAPDFVKLDIGLVRGIDTDPTRRALVAGMAFFAADRKLELIAEGIETPAELETLRRLGVPLGQGYLLGRPQPGSNARSWRRTVDVTVRT